MSGIPNTKTFKTKIGSKPWKKYFFSTYKEINSLLTCAKKMITNIDKNEYLVNILSDVNVFFEIFGYFGNVINHNEYNSYIYVMTLTVVCIKNDNFT